MCARSFRTPHAQQHDTHRDACMYLRVKEACAVSIGLLLFAELVGWLIGWLVGWFGWVWLGLLLMTSFQMTTVHTLLAVP